MEKGRKEGWREGRKGGKYFLNLQLEMLMDYKTLQNWEAQLKHVSSMFTWRTKNSVILFSDSVTDRCPIQEVAVFLEQEGYDNFDNLEMFSNTKF